MQVLRVIAVTTLAAACMAGCGKKDGAGEDADEEEPAADVGDTADTHDPAGEPVCCGWDPASCECVQIGGTRGEDGSCEVVCDTDPTGWTLRQDENGCYYWHVPEDAPSCSAAEAGEEPEAVEEDAEPLPEPAPEDAEPEPEAEEEPEPVTDATTG